MWIGFATVMVAILLVCNRIERQFMNKEDATFRSRFEDAIERLNSRLDKIEEALSRHSGKIDRFDRGGIGPMIEAALYTNDLVHKHRSPGDVTVIDLQKEVMLKIDELHKSLKIILPDEGTS